MKTCFLGTGAFGRATLDALVSAGLPPVLVVTRPPRRRRRRGAEEPTAVHRAAAQHGLPVFAPEKVNRPEALARLRACAADLFVVAEYGQILSQALLDIPRFGAINVHSSLLPRHRGASPIVAALLAGDDETGVSIQRVVHELDAGPVLAERRVSIAPDDDAGTLHDKLAPLGGELAVEVVRAFAAGAPPEERPQDPAGVTHCRRLAKADLWLDWTRPARELARRVRALRPRPGARARLDRTPPLDLRIHRAEAAPGSAVPGAVAAVGDSGLDVGTGDGLLRITELTPAGSRAMDAQAFRNGYRLSAGERFRRDVP